MEARQMVLGVQKVRGGGGGGGRGQFDCII